MVISPPTIFKIDVLIKPHCNLQSEILPLPWVHFIIFLLQPFLASYFACHLCHPSPCITAYINIHVLSQLLHLNNIHFIGITSKIHGPARNITVLLQACILYDVNKIEPLIYTFVLSRGPYNILHIFSSPECSLINMALQAT
jgi:hypothetical protein